MRNLGIAGNVVCADSFLFLKNARVCSGVSIVLFKQNLISLQVTAYKYVESKYFLLLVLDSLIYIPISSHPVQ